MSAADSKLLSVLEAILIEQHAAEETWQLPVEELRRVQRLILDYLEISDRPSSREPHHIAEFIYWNCWSASRDAAERWLRSLTDEEVKGLQLGDVLSALAPGQDGGINELAEENERRDQ
jgi:hypothetical protein